MVTMDKLLFFIQKGYNVLFEGEHGIGKTALVKEAFEKAGLKWAYFSGATMDPYIDFCGVPVKIETKDGSYIELIKPKHLATNEIQALFFDEFNRSHKKVRNAVMELIQFKTINGQPFSKDLKIVWAAINPDDEDGTYNVEPMDPAQRDRFHVHLKFKYECSKDYFIKAYGEFVGKAAVQFWESLDDKQKKLVSPRRLDYAIKAYQEGADVRDFLPASSHPNRLAKVIASGPAEKTLDKLLKNEAEAEKYLADENNYLYVIKTIIANEKYMEFFIPLLPPEKMALLYEEDAKVKAFMQKDLSENKNDSVFAEPLIEVVVANQNVKSAEQIKAFMAKAGVACDRLAKFEFNKNAPNNNGAIFGALAKENEAKIRTAYNLPSGSARTRSVTAIRRDWYQKIKSNIGPNPTVETARSALLGLNEFLVGPFSMVKRDAPDVMNVINHLLISLARQGKDWKFIRETVAQNPRVKWARHRFGKTTLRDIELAFNGEVANKKQVVSQTVSAVVASKAAAPAAEAKPVPAASPATVQKTVAKNRTFSQVTDPKEMEAVWKAYKGNGGKLSFEGIEKDPSFGLKFAKGNHARRIMLKWDQMLKSKPSPNVVKLTSVA